MSSPSGSPMSPSATTHSPLSPSYATLSFHKSDIIRLVNFPPDIVSSLGPLILASWPPGIESHRAVGQSYDYKLKGRPFGTFRSQQLVGGVHLLRSVFAFLRRHCWDLACPVVCSTRYTAKDTLIFRRRATPLPNAEWLALAPAGDNRLRVVYDADGVRLWGDANGDHDHLAVLNSAIKKTLEGLDCFKDGSWSHDSFEFVLKGRVWRPRAGESVKMRVLLLKLLETMEEHGWKLYTTFVHRTGWDDFRMLDTWYFVRECESAGAQRHTKLLREELSS